MFGNLIRPLYIALILVVQFIFEIPFTKAQSTYFTPINSENIIKIESNALSSSDFHSSIKPFINCNTLIRSIEDSSISLKSNSFIKRILNQDLLQRKTNNLLFDLNPIVYLKAGLENNNHSFSDLKIGIQSKVELYKKLTLHTWFFYGKIAAQSQFLNYIARSSIIPHYGKYIKKTGDSYIYGSLNGYISYSPLSYLNFQLGKDKNFWGDGYRSLFLSDHSNSYPFFKSTLKLWKFNYVNLFSALKDIDTLYNDYSLHRKYTASHYLSINILKNLNFSLFESVVFNPIDSIGGNRGFDINYLNPVIFYRPVEFSLGSPDNVLMGVGFKLKLLKDYYIYGQLILDEFILSKIKARKGDWENKQGYQIGLKTFKLLTIPNLYALVEFNYVRPYVYSHANPIRNYGNYYQPLAHPLGANFKESIGILRYDIKRMTISSKLVYAVYGENSGNLNSGHDPYLSYQNRISQSGVRNTGHEVGQGIKTHFYYGEFKIIYLVNPKMNLGLEAGITYRRVTNNLSESSIKSVYVGLKTNLYNESADY